MRRRLLVAFIGLTMLAALGFAIPLGVVVGQRQAEQDRRELTILAARAAGQVPVADGRLGHPRFPLGEPRQLLGLYGIDGVLVSGHGPERLEQRVLLRSDGVGYAVVASQRVVTVPVFSDGHIAGLVRAAEPVTDTDARVHAAWIRVGALSALAIAMSCGAALIASRRLSRPLERLAGDAERIGDGDFTVTPSRSGLREVDLVGDALGASARRVGDLVARSEAFAVEASHQLKTPLTGLRLTLETELAAPRPDPRTALSEAVADVDRLQATVATLLSLAREVRPAPRPLVVLDEVIEHAAQRWRTAAKHAGRSVVATPGPKCQAAVSIAAMDHVLDVLIENALLHGVGQVTLTAEADGGRAVVAVADEGGRPDDATSWFQEDRRGGETTTSTNDNSHGVGLSLARRLVAAEGGLIRVTPDPNTTVEVAFPLQSFDHHVA